MQRRPAQSRWADHVWEPHGVVPGFADGAPRVLVEDGGMLQRLYPGFALVLYRDEAEGYYLNLSAQDPRVFVLWRMEGEEALPLEVTASSEEAGRWLDGGHSVDGVAMPREVFAWAGAWVEANYKPQPKTRIKPRSFKHPRDRA